MSLSAPEASTAQTTSAPDVAIRSKPPNPKRLSRKVLIAGAGLAFTVIVAALMLGLSPSQRHVGASQEAMAAASGPPETITQADAQYDPANLTRPDVDSAMFNAASDQLQPPHDQVWTNAHAGAGGISAQSAGPDPLQTARSSPILFAGSPRAQAADAANARDSAEANLDSVLIAPRSRYTIQAGNVIAAALVTGLNSDLPGRVIAQVTAPVFDSVSGDYLLIPQGARLIGSYQSGARYGDHRIMLAWDRLIMPNGESINLHQMNASDPTGAAGLADITDNHLGGLGGAIGLSAIISVIADRAQNDSQASLAQNIGDAAAQQAAQTGSQIVQRELTVHPTLRVRPGASVRVLVTRDMSLRPYPGVAR